MTQFYETRSYSPKHDGIERKNKPDVLILIGIFLCVGLMQGALAFHWFSLHLFDQFNVLFDTDPNTWLRYGSSTHPDVGTSKHPLAAYYAGIPVLVISKLVGSFSGTGDPANIRILLALCVAPLVVAIKQCFVYLTVRCLGLSIREALIITGISIFSFSSIVFGAVPETYGYTGLLTAIGFYCVAQSISSHRWWILPGLLASSFLSIGASTANAIGTLWFLWMHGVVQRGYTLYTIIRALLLATFVSIITLSTFWGLSELRGVSLHPSNVFLPNTHDIDTYSPSVGQQLLNFARFPERLGQSLVATLPVEKGNVLATENDIYQFELSYNPLQLKGAALAQYALGVIVLLVGTIGITGAEKRWRHIAILSLTFIGSYALIFSFYGHNTFLYSQHWQVPAVLLLAATLRTRLYNSKGSYVVLSIALGGLVICLVATMLALNDLLYTACGDRCDV